MRARLLTALLVATALSVTPAAAGHAVPEEAPNPWQDMRVMNMAHSGGEDEAPMNTMYAFERAQGVGADMLELDVHSSADGHLVVIHDATVDRTTNGTGRVVDMTLDEIRELDAAHWFVPGRSAVHGLPDDAYPLRGARYGEVAVPGYQPKDFRIPTLREVFKQFPDTPINIEIKGTSDTDIASFLRTGRLLAEFLNKSGRTDVIVASFKDEALLAFHQQAPQIGLAPGMASLVAYFLFDVQPMPGTVALQVPVRYQGIPVATREFVERAHADGYVVHVWFSGTAPDDAATYNRIIDTCADGLMPAKPSVLEAILDERGIERPGQPGLDPCAGSGRATQVEPGVRYVAMGDSFSAGSGVLPSDPEADPRCARSLRNYPHVIAERIGARLTDVTCGAAETSHYREPQYDGVAPQLEALGPRTRLVTMTIGGNDSGVFIDAISRCGALGVLSAGQGSPCQDTYGSSFADTVREKTFPALVAALRAVTRRAPRAEVAILGYPWILPERVGCFDRMPVARGDVPYLRHLQWVLNDAVRRAAATTGVTYVNLNQVSDGHDACQPIGTRWVEPVTQGTNPVVVHPNALGERKMARQTMAVLDLRR